MFKLLLLIIGLGGGATGATAWLLSDPDASATPVSASPGDRLALLKARFAAALAEGTRQGAETENRLRHELDAYRLHPNRPGTSSAR